MPICGVLGWPVRHSRSPAMHEAGYAALGLDDWRYQLLPVPPELFEETVRGLPGAGFVGANVTIPHKEAALALADEATDVGARDRGREHAHVPPDGRIHADNTDAPGLIDALPFDPAGAHRGRARRRRQRAGGRCGRCCERGRRDVLVWNRTRERAERLCAEIGGQAVDAPARTGPICSSTRRPLVCADEDPFKALPLGADDLDGYPMLVDLAYTSRPDRARPRRARGRRRGGGRP